MVFYDLPTKEVEEIKKLTLFRKQLLRTGYMSIQKSVYAKVIRNHASLTNEIKKVKDFAPVNGKINLLYLSLAEFKRMVVISGDKFDMALFSDEMIEI